MRSRYMDSYDSDPNMQGDGPPIPVLGRVQETGGATNSIIFDSTGHPNYTRCAELAELEREIGRAVIGERLMNTVGDRLQRLG